VHAASRACAGQFCASCFAHREGPAVLLVRTTWVGCCRTPMYIQVGHAFLQQRGLKSHTTVAPSNTVDICSSCCCQAHAGGFVGEVRPAYASGPPLLSCTVSCMCSIRACGLLAVSVPCSPDSKLQCSCSSATCYQPWACCVSPLRVRSMHQHGPAPLSLLSLSGK
jgi:hypothetical protein